LEPDVVTTYLGINESQLAPSSYSDLYTMWEGGRLGGRPSMLTELRLFQGLRFFVLGLRKAKMVAVTPEQTMENLNHLADTVRAVGGKLLLMSEASQPSPAAFSVYWAVMKSIAEEREDVAWLDTATPVAEAGTAMFLDQNHLSQPGHERVATMMVEKLQALGWIE